MELARQTIRLFTIQTEKGETKIPVAQWTLAYVAKELIYVGEDGFSNPISDGLIAFYSNWCTSILDPPNLLAFISKRARRRRGRSILIRMDYEQLATQGLSPIAEIARTLILFEDMPSSLASNTYDPESEFHSLTGLRIRDFIALGFACFTRSRPPRDPPFAASDISHFASPGGFLSASSISQFLKIVSTDYDTFRNQVQIEELPLPGYERYALNPLYKWPILQTQSEDGSNTSKFIAPIPSLILSRATQGIYWDLMDNWIRSIMNSPRSTVPDFPGFFGRAFEHYVGELLSEFIASGRLFPEQEFGSRSRKQLSCDWIVLEDEDATLIECKTSRLNKAIKATGNPREFLSQAIEIYAKAIVQILRTKRAILDGQISLPNDPKQFRGMIVIFDHSLASNIHLREDLRQAVPSIDPSFSPLDVDDLDYRIIPIRLLERFTAKISDIGLRGAFEPANWKEIHEVTGHDLPNILKNKFGDFQDHFRVAFEQ